MVTPAQSWIIVDDVCFWADEFFCDNSKSDVPRFFIDPICISYAVRILGFCVLLNIAFPEEAMVARKRNSSRAVLILLIHLISSEYAECR